MVFIQYIVHVLVLLHLSNDKSASLAGSKTLNHVPAGAPYVDNKMINMVRKMFSLKIMMSDQLKCSYNGDFMLHRLVYCVLDDVFISRIKKKMKRMIL